MGSEDFARRGPDAVPWGRCHSVDLQEGMTLCGRPVRSLRLWREIPWKRARMVGVDVCERCADLTD